MSRYAGHRIPFGLTLPEELLNRLDDRRGLIPRTKFVEKLIENALRFNDADADARRGEPLQR